MTASTLARAVFALPGAIPPTERADRSVAGVIGRVQGVDGQVVEVAVAVQPAQAAVADLDLDGGDVAGVQIGRRMELRPAGVVTREHAVGHQHVKMDVTVEVVTETIHESHGAELGFRRRARAALPQCRFYRPQEDPQEAGDHLGLLAQMPADPLGHRQHPLAAGHAGQGQVGEVGGGLYHPSRRARGADVATLARERDQEVVAAGRAVGAGKPVVETSPKAGSRSDSMPQRRYSRKAFWTW